MLDRIKNIIFFLSLLVIVGGCNPKGISILGGNIVNLKDFGAKGDGETNDWQSFKQAIAVAERENKQLYIPKGHYKIKSPKKNTPMKIPISLKGDGAAQTFIEVFRSASIGFTPGLVFSGINNTIADLSIVANHNVTNSGSCVLVMLKDNKRLKFEDVVIDGQGTTAHGIELIGDIDGLTFYGGEIKNCQLGLFKTNKRVSVQKNIRFERVMFTDIKGEALAFNSPAYKMHLVNQKGVWKYRDIITGQDSGAKFHLVNPGTAHSQKVTNQSELKIRWRTGAFQEKEIVSNGKGTEALVKSIDCSEIKNVEILNCEFYRNASLPSSEKGFGVDLAFVQRARLYGNNFKGSFKEAYHIEDGSEDIIIKGGNILLETSDARGIRIYSPSRNIIIDSVNIKVKKEHNVIGKIGIDFTSKPVKDHGVYEIKNVNIEGFGVGVALDSNRSGGKIDKCVFERCDIGLVVNVTEKLEVENNRFIACDIGVKERKNQIATLKNNTYIDVSLQRVNKKNIKKRE